MRSGCEGLHATGSANLFFLGGKKTPRRKKISDSPILANFQNSPRSIRHAAITITSARARQSFYKKESSSNSFTIVSYKPEITLSIHLSEPPVFQSSWLAASCPSWCNQTFINLNHVFNRLVSKVIKERNNIIVGYISVPSYQTSGDIGFSILSLLHRETLHLCPSRC